MQVRRPRTSVQTDCNHNKYNTPVNTATATVNIKKKLALLWSSFLHCWRSETRDDPTSPHQALLTCAVVIYFCLVIRPCVFSALEIFCWCTIKIYVLLTYTYLLTICNLLILWYHPSGRPQLGSVCLSASEVEHFTQAAIQTSCYLLKIHFNSDEPKFSGRLFSSKWWLERQKRVCHVTDGSQWHSRPCRRRQLWMAFHQDIVHRHSNGSSPDDRTCQQLAVSTSSHLSCNQQRNEN